jgi:hypothetical protein
LNCADVDHLRKIADEQVTCAERYAEARSVAGNAEASLNLMLAAQLKDIRAEKPNVGMEFAQIMLIEIDGVAREFYEAWKTNEAVYKGLEKLLEARASKLIFEQSVMKRTREGERFGS